MKIKKCRFFIILTISVFIDFSCFSMNELRIKTEYEKFIATIDNKDYQLEAMIYRPSDNYMHPLIIMNHGRNGKYASVYSNESKTLSTLCSALAEKGYVVMLLVRRGYGNSQGPDSELKETAVTSGLEACKDVKSAIIFMKQKSYVTKDKIVVIGHSQGGWVALASSTQKIDGLLGTVNLCGGTNYENMGSGKINEEVQSHWIWASGILGEKNIVPTLWIYSENDRNHPVRYVNKMFEAFEKSGGKGKLIIKPPYKDNGHYIMGEPDLFINDILDFFKSIDFPIMDTFRFYNYRHIE